jgi:hypothetical protein
MDYITHLANDGYKASTIQAKLAAIGFKHEALGYINPVKSPDVRTAMSGIRRTIGTAPARKAPISLNDLRTIIGALPRNLRGKRDKAMLLIGWAGAFRRVRDLLRQLAALTSSAAVVAACRTCGRTNPACTSRGPAPHSMPGRHTRRA